jgi:carboxyl-terminal processing protease
VRGIIFDLRWCPGGYLDPALNCARLFLGEATIATIKSRNAQPDVKQSTGEGAFQGLPMVVLINEQTSGGAELIACALQDHKRALMVGERSRGKASVQSQIPSFEFPDAPAGLNLKLTTGIFYRPSGKNLNRFKNSKPTDDWGVLPDQAFPVSRAMSEQLKHWWELQALRPGPSAERLPLDNLDADPQLKAALSALRKIVKD